MTATDPKSFPVVEIPLGAAMLMHAAGYAKIRTGEIILTAAGKKQLGAAAKGVRLVIADMGKSEGTLRPVPPAAAP